VADDRRRAGCALFNAGAYRAAVAVWTGDTPPDGVDQPRAIDAAPSGVRFADGGEGRRAIVDGESPSVDDLGPGGIAAAAVAVARSVGLDPGPIERAATHARDGDGRSVALLADFVSRPPARSLIHDRLRRLTDRRAQEDDAVDGLFEGG
jgi:hypothetical protein